MNFKLLPGFKLKQPIDVPAKVIALPVIKVEAPCHAKWDEMDGDQRSRHCLLCEKSVHNFSELQSKSVRELISTGDKVCIRFRRNPDGSVVTQDNDSYSRRNWLAKFGTVAAGLFSMMAFGGCEKLDPTAAWTLEEPLPAGPQSDVSKEPAELMGKMVVGEMHDPLAETDVAKQIDLPGKTWRSTNGLHVFESELSQVFSLVEFVPGKGEFGFGQFVTFDKQGCFVASNATQCGNDVSITIKGRYKVLPENKLEIFVESIDRNEYCNKKSETPNKMLGVYQMAKKAGKLTIAKVVVR